MILLNRLKLAGVESLLCKSKFGFKSGVSTSDALRSAHRFIDKAIDQQNGEFVFLASDLAKAFSSISLSALLNVLHRFGLHQDFIGLVYAIYSSRELFAYDQQQNSEKRVQHLGISQGCPLSPMLFFDNDECLNPRRAARAD